MDTELSIESNRRVSPGLALESEQVLDAIMRGENSLPKIKAATGIGYDRLATILYYIEFTIDKVRRTETPVGGFDRYEIHKSTKCPPGQFAPITPMAVKTTPMSLKADSLAIQQRDAPYCVKCRAMMFMYGLAKRKHQDWKCPKCKVIFQGSRTTKEKVMAHLDPHEEAERKVEKIVARGTRAPMITQEPIDEFKERSVVEENNSLDEWLQMKAAELGTPEIAPEASPVGDTAEDRGYPIPPGLDPERTYDLQFDAPPTFGYDPKNAIKMSDIPEVGPIVIDGRLRMNISLNIDAAEMATWPSYRISDFWGGIEKLLKAANKKY